VKKVKRKKRIKTFYTKKQVLTDDNTNYSQSPQKPKLLLDLIRKEGLKRKYNISSSFKPFSVDDFYIAHTKDYVDNFFTGTGNCSSNNLAWSKQFVDSVCYTNSSLYHAIRNSIVNPGEISFSPTSGFHHAKPERGLAFCTFSGQVIASKKIYDEFGISGAYLDLDGHYGNSIEDTREFVQDLDKIIPKDCNINPRYKGKQYVLDFQLRMERLGAKLVNGEIGYLVWCHGADSHEWDDEGKQCNTEEWLKCSQIFYSWVHKMDKELHRPIPLTLVLFGGYRKDDYNSVLYLHLADIVTCLNILLGYNIDFRPAIKPNILKKKSCGKI